MRTSITLDGQEYDIKFSGQHNRAEKLGSFGARQLDRGMVADAIVRETLDEKTAAVKEEIAGADLLTRLKWKITKSEPVASIKASESGAIRQLKAGTQERINVLGQKLANICADVYKKQGAGTGKKLFNASLIRVSGGAEGMDDSALRKRLTKMDERFGPLLDRYLDIWHETANIRHPVLMLEDLHDIARVMIRHETGQEVASKIGEQPRPAWEIRLAIKRQAAASRAAFERMDALPREAGQYSRL